ncbi:MULTISPECIES: hypothetical protein [unclassified Arthrobacter]|uniref:hypothetical protein n=1 Tax=unclassified Arthrobacter TaxID=235627 RepID=UPI003397A673
MTKRTGKSKTKSKNQRHLKAVPSAPKMPLQLVLNHRVIDSMAVDFIQHTTEFPDPADAFECLELVKLFLTAQHAINGTSSATAIDSEGVEAAAGSIAVSLDPEEFDDAFHNIYFALHSFIHFLKGTGRWTGSAEAYEELHSALGSGIASATPSLPDIQVPDLSDEEQDAAFEAMPLIQRASSLLEWLGTGKDVTSTGALRLKDIEPAAAAVGVLARGKRAAGRPAALFELEAAEGRPQTLQVGTMHDVPVLREIWAALVGTGLIKLGSTRAVPSQEAAAWNSAKIEDRLALRRALSLVVLVGVLTDVDQVWDQEAVAGTLLAVLAYGSTDEPMPVAELESLASMDLAGSFLSDTDLENTYPGDTDVDDPESDAANLHATGFEEIYASFAAFEAKHKLTLLAELGLVETGTDYVVPPVAIQCVQQAMGFLNPADQPAQVLDSGSNVVALHGPPRSGRPPQGR